MAALQLQKRIDAASPEDTSGHLGPFFESVDQERGLICSLLQNPYIVDRDGGDKPIADLLANKSWQDVLNVRRLGIEYGVKVNPDNSDLAQEMRFVPLDSGSINQVSLVEFAGGESRVFKPDAFAIQTDASSVLSAHLADWGLPLNQPRAVAKNIGTRNIAEVLGAESLVPHSRIYQHDSTVGMLQEKAEGRALSIIARSSYRFSDGPLAKNPEFLRDLNKLQWIDALTLQADRHDSNIIVDYRNGEYHGLKGIDNDFSFGAKDVALKDIVARRGGNVIGDDTSYGYNAGLPPLIDEETYHALIAKGAATRLMKAVDGLLSTDELAAYGKRVHEVIDHARTLGASGRVVGSTLMQDVVRGNSRFGLEVEQRHPWADSKSADGKSAFELSSNASNSYFGRLVGVRR